MTLESRLASELVREHPGRAASVLERFDPPVTAGMLERESVAAAAEVIERFSPQYAADVLAAAPDARVSALLEVLPVGIASRLARRLPEGRVEPVLGRLPERVARGIRASIRFAEHTAGALMDPSVLALPEDFTAREALARVREAAEQARYNLYVVDRSQKLVGAVNLRELLLAKGKTPLSDLMVRNPIALPASADRAAIVSHPGWKEVHALPVVDEDGSYLGAVRYRTLRELEELFFRGGRRDADAQAALGELFSAGASGVLDAFATSRAGDRESAR